ncbi:hypothetical protein ACEWB4_07020 [Sphingobium sp. sgz301303]|uniref:hypothetical protein n=1 Tax=Sphingobium sp. sgz301304 TaxID=3341828 RepID=UPI0035A5B62E
MHDSGPLRANSTTLFKDNGGGRDMEKDVNYLLHRRQMALIHAQSSRSPKGRAAYEGLARGYSEQIDAYRQENMKLLALAH